jgi:hypothetical protein
MKPRTLRDAAVAAVVIASALSATDSPAQSADALLDKLVQKGVLTPADAKELREEMDQGFTKAYQVKSGMPDWVTALKFSGDFRGRVETFQGDNSAFEDRTRFRYRLRLGVTAIIQDNFEVGVRLTSSEPVPGSGGNTSTFGGDPISGNTTLGDNGSKKWVFIDLAYAKWYAFNTKQNAGSLTIGKMENPFTWASSTFAPLIFDLDYTPEGGALNYTFRPNDVHAIQFNGGAYVLDEFSTGGDPYMLAAQARWNAAWDKHWSSTLSAAILSIQSAGQLTNGAVPNVNVGNYRNAGTGALTYNFNPIFTDAALQYTFDHGPLYKQPFPIRVWGEYLVNPAAPSSADNDGFDVGITFGKAGKKGLWELTYLYRYLGANSWYEEVVDSDFGAYYATPWQNSGMSAANTPSNYRAGTNVKGHIIRASYSPYDFLTFQVTAYLTSLIQKTAPGTPAGTPPDGGDSGMTRIQVDAVWKF